MKGAESARLRHDSSSLLLYVFIYKRSRGKIMTLLEDFDISPEIPNLKEIQHR